MTSGYQALRMHFLDASYNELANYYLLKSPSSVWQYTKLVKTAPSNTKYVKILLYSAWSHVSNGYWDDISITKSAPSSADKISVSNETQALEYKITNYPNPFNPTTKILYSMPNSGHVYLKIFDSLGREIKTLVDKNQEAGSYEINFDGSGLTSGVYFCRLVTGDYSHTQKLVLSK